MIKGNIMKLNKNNEVVFEISEKIVPGFSKTKEKQYVSIIGLTKENKIAFVKIQEKNRSWELPGGAVLKEENIIDAANREFFEETGMKLIDSMHVITIKNVYENTNVVHSCVFIVVGIIDETIPQKKIDDSEIIECLLLNEAPNECTFGQKYINKLIDLAVSKFSVEKNYKMWNKAAKSYDEQTIISENDIHYGPLIPGEKKLQLIPNLMGADVLDLGCGAGHNLISMKSLGAKTGLGIDFCEEQIKKAKEKLDQPFEFIVGNILDSTLIKKEKFDFVISVFVISFIKDLDGFFDIIKQNLKSGGYVIISTDHPNRNLLECNKASVDTNNNNSRVRYWNIPNDNSIPYIHCLHTFEEISSAFKNAGLVLDDIIEPQVLPLDKIENAPYISSYYVNRHNEMLANPYTIIFKAHKP